MNTNIQIVKHSITTETFLRFFLIVGGLALIYFMRDFVVAFFVAILIASSINPVATKLEKYKIPRSATVLSILLFILSIFVAIVVLLVPIISNELSGLLANTSEFQNRILQNVSTYTGDPNFLNNILSGINPSEVGSSIKSILSGVSGGVKSAASTVITFMVQLVIILVISFYLGVQERGVEKFLRLITPLKHEDYVISLWDRSQRKIVAWVKGQLILALIVGILVYIVLTFIGVPHALLFALIAAVFETIPIVGMTLATIPPALIAFLTGGFSMFVAVLIFFLILGQIENHILSPMIVNKVVGIPSLVVIIGLILGGSLLGFWGVLLAVPVSAAIMEYIHDLEKDKDKMRQILN